MATQSLFRACRKIYKAGASGTQPVGNYDIEFEYYTQEKIDANVEAIKKGEATKCTFGDSDQSKVVLVAGDTITIPDGFNLTPVSPKKSLVILCNTLVNNGTISMTAKGPNVEPQDWYILGKIDNYGADDNILIPAYANNAVPRKNFAAYTTVLNGTNGNNGTNRNCGSGGQGCSYPGGVSSTRSLGATGSGYAFGGGGGGQGLDHYSASNVRDVDTTYPMRGGPAAGASWGADGGVGNPVGARTNGATSLVNRSNVVAQNIGVGGRVVIFCSEFINNGTISANGVATKRTWTTNDKRCCNYGGASGGGAVDIFYNTLTTEGTNTATGGATFTYNATPGKGGNGSVTLLQWTIEKVIKEDSKMFSEENWIYLFDNYVDRLKEDEVL